MKTINEFNVTPGNQKLIVTKMDKVKIYFSGYIFKIPGWTSRKNDAIIFQNGNQADNFSKAYKGEVEIY